MKNFIAGDKVKVIDKQSPFYNEIGLVTTIKFSNLGDTIVVYFKQTKLANNLSIKFYKDELEHANIN